MDMCNGARPRSNAIASRSSRAINIASSMWKQYIRKTCKGMVLTTLMTGMYFHSNFRERRKEGIRRHLHEGRQREHTNEDHAKRSPVAFSYWFRKIKTEAFITGVEMNSNFELAFKHFNLGGVRARPGQPKLFPIITGDFSILVRSTTLLHIAIRI